MSFFRPGALLSVAYKEFLHIARDWRIILILITFPPAFTLLMGHAFEEQPLSGVPIILRDADGSPESQQLADYLATKTAFALKRDAHPTSPLPDLLHAGVQGIIIIPPGWGKGLNDSDPIPLQAVFDGSDTTTASQLEGLVEQALGEFQIKARDAMVDNMPDEMIELGKKIPEDFRHKIVSSMEPWTVKSQIVYNPELKFIDFVTPGIVGLILQLLTVPLMAVTITRERETGTLTQLLLTSLRHWEIVVGKVLPYLGLSIVMITAVIGLTHWHFGVHFVQPGMLALLCFLFLLCSLGLGLVISAFCNTQAQAIQFTVFFLLPIIPLCGAFAPLDQLPETIRAIAELFPLTHFCRAFRLVNLAHAEFSFVLGDVAFLAIGAFVTFAAAALLLRRAQT
jgi:ABC-2 type transport system permease protein